jgi:hypothetical protein
MNNLRQHVTQHRREGRTRIGERPPRSANDAARLLP